MMGYVTVYRSLLLAGGHNPDTLLLLLLLVLVLMVLLVLLVLMLMLMLLFLLSGAAQHPNESVIDEWWQLYIRNIGVADAGVGSHRRDLSQSGIQNFAGVVAPIDATILVEKWFGARLCLRLRLHRLFVMGSIVGQSLV
jgi:hypothetical protein